jgi:hypothetical protein
MKLKVTIIFLCISASLLLSCKKNNNPDDTSVAYSFVVVGCNRIDKADSNLTLNPSTANVAQLNRTLEDVAVLSPKPKYLFFAGDMVLGNTSDPAVLRNQLEAWKKIYEASPVKAAGIELVAIQGNHESQTEGKQAVPSAEEDWCTIMAPYIHGSNGPKLGGADSLWTDQSKQTYSFDFNDSHFIVINTDPVGRDWRPPSHWIAADIAAAHANSDIKHIFAISHKPAYAWDYKVPGGKNDGIELYKDNRDILWNALENNNAEAMISAHNHVYSAFRPNNKTWMIVAGNGGSKLEKTVPESGQFYGFTLIQVLNNGNVIEKSYGRNFDSSYFAPSPASKYPTTLRDSNFISWK